MTTVQHLAATHAPSWWLAWLAAWLCDPIVSLLVFVAAKANLGKREGQL